VLGPVALLGVAEGTYAALLLRDPAEDPRVAMWSMLFAARAAAVICLALGLFWAAAREVTVRRSLRRLAQDLTDAPGPGMLRDALARKLGDDDLRVAYWLEDPGCFVDEHGRAVAPERRPGEGVTTLRRAGRTLAVVAHDRFARGDQDLGTAIGAAARLAVDNERLRAELRFRLAALQASQSRVVAHGDATRRQVERDLHDGAQQRLLGVCCALRQAHQAAQARGDEEQATELAEAGARAVDALGELRGLAHGIFPAILGDAGLSAALQTLADRAPVAVDADVLTEKRYAPGIETCAYVVALDGIADAVRRSSSWVSVHVGQDGGRLVVALLDDGAPRTGDGLLHAADRVGALGGTVHVGPRELTAEIPCES
jgi:signal transduction histidine kinase